MQKDLGYENCDSFVKEIYPVEVIRDQNGYGWKYVLLMENKHTQTGEVDYVIGELELPGIVQKEKMFIMITQGLMRYDGPFNYNEHVQLIGGVDYDFAMRLLYEQFNYSAYEDENVRSKTIVQLIKDEFLDDYFYEQQRQIRKGFMLTNNLITQFKRGNMVFSAGLFNREIQAILNTIKPIAMVVSGRAQTIAPSSVFAFRKIYDTTAIADLEELILAEEYMSKQKRGYEEQMKTVLSISSLLLKLVVNEDHFFYGM